MWLSNWTTSSKQTVRQLLQWPAIFDPCQDKESIPSFSISFKNRKTNSMLPERIRLFFTNFPLVSVSQHNANSIAIFLSTTLTLSPSFDTTLLYFHQYNFPAILSISLSLRWPSHRALPISWLDDPIKTHDIYSHIYSSYDS